MVEFDKISERVAQHRSKKDVGDGTFENLCEYANEAKKVSEIAQNIRLKVPHLVGWDKRARIKTIVEKVVLVGFMAIVTGIVVGVVVAYINHWLFPPK